MRVFVYYLTLRGFVRIKRERWYDEKEVGINVSVIEQLIDFYMGKLLATEFPEALTIRISMFS